MKEEKTLSLLMIMDNIIQKFPRFKCVRVQAWQYPSLSGSKLKTLRIMIEVRVNEEGTN